MRKGMSLALSVFATVIFACITTTIVAQSNDGKLANVIGGGSNVKCEEMATNSGGSLTITAPDGRAFRRAFRAGASPEISLSDKQLEGLPDGVYNYELRLIPVLTAAQKETLLKARGSDDDPEAERAGRRRPTVPAMVQSGAFSILNGSIVVGGAVESQRTGKTNQPRRSTNLMSGNTFSRLFNHRVALGALPDVVTPDDEDIQGSLCVGLDCVNNESFGFDTIRLKENNTRISFNDTSSAAGFPTNDWTIRANSSANGGANFLAFVDRGTSENGDETGTIVFEVDAGASANALKVSSNSKVGLRTATPVLDIHMNTGDTPAVRFEQNASGGFTAQTWDIGANEANFFVRDVTGGSRLPFRVRPGAPTSSIDISASGDVGVGTASPTDRLTVSKSSAESAVTVNADANQQATVYFSSAGSKKSAIYKPAGSDDLRFNIVGVGDALTMLHTNGFIGISTTAPTDNLSVNGTASKPGGGSWSVFSDERLKNINGRYNNGLKAVMQLQPLRYNYRPDNVLGLKADKEYVGFGAQALQKIIPEAVSRNENGYLQVNNDPILWTMLNAIKEQQKEISELKGQIRKLQRTAHRRRR